MTWFNGLARSFGQSSGFEKDKESVPLLEKFLGELYIGARLATPEARRTIEESLLELTIHGGHTSNGLLITQNGYFITAFHCVDKSSDLNIDVSNGDGRYYPVERVCHAWPRMDLALVKARVYGEEEPVHLPVYEGRVEQMAESSVCSLSRWNRQIHTSMGVVDTTPVFISCISEDHIHVNPQESFGLTFNSTIRGDSGGVVVTSHGRVMGTIFSSDLKTRSHAIRFNFAIGLVNEYVQLLKGVVAYR